MRKCNRWQGTAGKLLITASAVIVAAAAAGCASQPEQEIKGGLAVRVEVGGQLNPDASGRPSPVFVRIYQLSDKTAFEQASYADLANSDKATLGATLLARKDVEVCPVEKAATDSAASGAGCAGEKMVEFALDHMAAAEYVAVMAEFYHLHDPQGNWRAVTGYDEGGFFGTPALVIHLERSSIGVGFE